MQLRFGEGPLKAESGPAKTSLTQISFRSIAGSVVTNFGKDTMKIMHKYLAVGALLASSLVAVTPARADDPLVGLYFKADVGGSWIESTELREFFGPVAPGSRVEFDAGPRFGLTAGYDVL